MVQLDLWCPTAVLFERFERRPFGELVAAGLTRDKVECLPDGHHDAEVQIHAASLAHRTGDLLESVWHVGLRSLVKYHVGVNRKRIPALRASSLPVAVRLHAAAINCELVGLANGATHAA